MKKLSKNRSRLIWTLLLVLIVPLSWYCKQGETVPPASPKAPAESALPLPPTEDNKKGAGKIYGRITNAETGEVLAGANVILHNTEQGAASNLKGDYFITNVLSGEYRVICSVIGYRSANNTVTVGNNKSVNLNFALKPSPLQGEKVTVTAKRETEIKDETMKFIAYDDPPKPIGGFKAIANNLVYPEESRKRGIEGMVILNAYILESGSVGEVNVLKSQITDECNIAAIEALKKTKWTPAKQRSKSVAVWVAIPVEFKLDKENKK